MTTVTPTTDTPAPATSLQGVVRLDDWGVIAAQGEDAASFLHGQLTQDLLLQRADEARLVAYCNPKGRMLFTAIAVQRDGQILLCAPRERIAPTVKRLAMFVLRAKVRLADASEQWALWGAAGDAVPAALPSPWWAVWRDGERLWVRLPAGAGVSRALLVQPADLAAPAGGALDPAHWRWLDVMSGVAHVTDPVVEAFVPQMLNYESVGGVNFKKGCYPGQEVVARSQFRGTLKRRAYLAHADGPLAAGQEIFHPADPEQPAGVVAQAAPNPAGGWNAIVSLQISAADGQALTAGGPQGAALRLLPLPYELLQDV
ncbi:folate-binding protein YgfZ [Tepidimonas taiwanensis]|uniref:tRNA-modifying protein YgfZ n=1 Tax=Tepidimonas taiwanensis TaxID=307486 RepID=A0A554X9L7_9BURK|nr:folate-binding protein YgfZ [Tepidimonas taiwanensis]MCX7693416.1 folate-binding protein YgfZ [Tepidimonas taiwanensis]TSE32517.1 tRNA-modifying protein YgfZ [Tepidimonas taiwanensis]UBQ06489.1 folate-binding protein YgfZ [Tepidimonas taiwanensis]